MTVKARSPLQSQAKRMPLRVAASVYQHELTGLARNAVRAPYYFKLLDQAARELASLAEVFYVDEAGKPALLDAETLAAGAFENGGDVLRLPSGKALRSLSVRRVDVLRAISDGEVAPTRRLIALAAQLLGSDDEVRDRLNALPAEYMAWKEGRAAAPPGLRARLSAIVVEAQASRVDRLRITT